MESSTNENVTLISQSSQKSGMPIKNVIVQHPQQQTSSIGTTVISSSQPSTMNPSSSLIKSLLANKVTMTTAGTVESNTTTVCKIASTINIQQVTVANCDMYTNLFINYQNSYKYIIEIILISTYSKTM